MRAPPLRVCSTIVRFDPHPHIDALDGELIPDGLVWLMGARPGALRAKESTETSGVGGPAPAPPPAPAAPVEETEDVEEASGPASPDSVESSTPKGDDNGAAAAPTGGRDDAVEGVHNNTGVNAGDEGDDVEEVDDVAEVERPRAAVGAERADGDPPAVTDADADVDTIDGPDAVNAVAPPKEPEGLPDIPEFTEEPTAENLDQYVEQLTPAQREQLVAEAKAAEEQRAAKDAAATAELNEQLYAPPPKLPDGSANPQEPTGQQRNVFIDPNTGLAYQVAYNGTTVIKARTEEALPPDGPQGTRSSVIMEPDVGGETYQSIIKPAAADGQPAPAPVSTTLVSDANGGVLAARVDGANQDAGLLDAAIPEDRKPALAAAQADPTFYARSNVSVEPDGAVFSASTAPVDGHPAGSVQLSRRNEPATTSVGTPGERDRVITLDPGGARTEQLNVQGVDAAGNRSGNIIGRNTITAPDGSLQSLHVGTLSPDGTTFVTDEAGNGVPPSDAQLRMLVTPELRAQLEARQEAHTQRMDSIRNYAALPPDATQAQKDAYLANVAAKQPELAAELNAYYTSTNVYAMPGTDELYSARTTPTGDLILTNNGTSGYADADVTDGTLDRQLVIDPAGNHVYTEASHGTPVNATVPGQQRTSRGVEATSILGGSMVIPEGYRLPSLDGTSGNPQLDGFPQGDADRFDVSTRADGLPDPATQRSVQISGPNADGSNGVAQVVSSYDADGNNFYKSQLTSTILHDGTVTQKGALTRAFPGEDLTERQTYDSSRSSNHVTSTDARSVATEQTSTGQQLSFDASRLTSTIQTRPGKNGDHTNTGGYDVVTDYSTTHTEFANGLPTATTVTRNASPDGRQDGANQFWVRGETGDERISPEDVLGFGQHVLTPADLRAYQSDPDKQWHGQIDRPPNWEDWSRKSMNAVSQFAGNVGDLFTGRWSNEDHEYDIKNWDDPSFEPPAPTPPETEVEHTAWDPQGNPTSRFTEDGRLTPDQVSAALTDPAAPLPEGAERLDPTALADAEGARTYTRLLDPNGENDHYESTEAGPTSMDGRDPSTGLLEVKQPGEQFIAPEEFRIPPELEARANATQLDAVPDVPGLTARQETYREQLAAAAADQRQQVMEQYFANPDNQYWVEPGANGAEPTVFAAAWVPDAAGGQPRLVLARTGIAGTSDDGVPTTADAVRYVDVPGNTDAYTRTIHDLPDGAARTDLRHTAYDTQGQRTALDQRTDQVQSRAMTGQQPLARTDASHTDFDPATGNRTGRQVASATHDDANTSMRLRTDQFRPDGTLLHTVSDDTVTTRNWDQGAVDGLVNGTEDLLVLASKDEFKPDEHGTSQIVPPAGSSQVTSHDEVSYDASGVAIHRTTDQNTQSVSSDGNGNDNGVVVSQIDRHGEAGAANSTTPLYVRPAGMSDEDWAYLQLQEPPPDLAVDDTITQTAKTTIFDPDGGRAGGNQSDGHQLRVVTDSRKGGVIRPDGSFEQAWATPLTERKLAEGFDDDTYYSSKMLRTNPDGTTIRSNVNGGREEVHDGDTVTSGPGGQTQVVTDAATERKDQDAWDTWEETWDKTSKYVGPAALVAGLALTVFPPSSGAGAALLTGLTGLGVASAVTTTAKYSEGDAGIRGFDVGLSWAGAVASFGGAGVLRNFARAEAAVAKEAEILGSTNLTAQAIRGRSAISGNPMGNVARPTTLEAQAILDGSATFQRTVDGANKLGLATLGVYGGDMVHRAQNHELQGWDAFLFAGNLVPLAASYGAAARARHTQAASTDPTVPTPAPAPAQPELQPAAANGLITPDGAPGIQIPATLQAALDGPGAGVQLLQGTSQQAHISFEELSASLERVTGRDADGDGTTTQGPATAQDIHNAEAVARYWRSQGNT